jgi:sporulation protein YlmC with PRC-barrel domain
MLRRLLRRFGAVAGARREYPREEVQKLQREVRDFLASGLRVPRKRLSEMERRERCSMKARRISMQDQSKIKKTDPDKKYRRVLAASTLAGDQVQNSAGEDLGKVDEIMIDIPAGKVAYAVLSFGGFLGMGNKLFAVPWSALKLDEDKKHFILDVDKKKLENAPGFDKDNWPDMADTSWGTRIFSYYGAVPYWETH